MSQGYVCSTPYYALLQILKLDNIFKFKISCLIHEILYLEKKHLLLSMICFYLPLKFIILISGMCEALEPDWLIAARPYPGFCHRMKRLGVFLLPLDGMLVHHRSLPHNSPGWREALWELKCLAQELTTQCPRPGLEAMRRWVHLWGHHASPIATNDTNQNLNRPASRTNYGLARFRVMASKIVCLIVLLRMNYINTSFLAVRP